MVDKNGDHITLREYVDRILEEREKAFLVRMEMQNAALQRESRNIEMRLEKLNELRQEVIQDRGAYVLRENLDARLGQVQNAVRSIEKRLAWMTGVGSLLVLIAGLVGSWIGSLFKGSIQK